MTPTTPGPHCQIETPRAIFGDGYKAWCEACCWESYGSFRTQAEAEQFWLDHHGETQR